MKSISLSIILLFSLNLSSQIQVTSDDLETMIGKWEGSITYLDYQSQEPYNMPAILIIEKGKNQNSLVLNNLYPNEPKANNSEKIRVTKNGKKLNKHTITNREELETGRIQIQTEHKGKDDNKKALIRYTYEFGADNLIIRKDVLTEISIDWIERSRYTYSKSQ